MNTALAWLTDEYRADLARQFDCPPCEVEAHLEARKRMNEWLAERREYDDPYGYEAGRERGRAIVAIEARRS